MLEIDATISILTPTQHVAKVQSSGSEWRLISIAKYCWAGVVVVQHVLTAAALVTAAGHSAADGRQQWPGFLQERHFIVFWASIP